ncbi:MAG TPA: hypothetical protein VF523_12260 [Burkholderiales bacterium]
MAPLQAIDFPLSSNLPGSPHLARRSDGGWARAMIAFAAGATKSPGDHEVAEASKPGTADLKGLEGTKIK